MWISAGVWFYIGGAVRVGGGINKIFYNFFKPSSKPIRENKLYIGLFLVLKRKRYNISFKDTKTKIDWYKALFLPVFVLILIFPNPLHKPTNNQQQPTGGEANDILW